MRLTVKELISQLQALGPELADAPILVYCSSSEDADFGHGVQVSTSDKSYSPEDRPYTKGDWPDCGEGHSVRYKGVVEFRKNEYLGKKVVIIK